jgi:hypothetical protein
LALGVPYFAHSPYYYPFHREPLLDSVASYANMAYNFGRATAAKSFPLSDGVYGVAANIDSETIIALWTTRTSARVKVSGLGKSHLADMYGNSIAADPADIALTGEPVYLSGQGTPTISAFDVAARPARSRLPSLSTWIQAPHQQYELTPTGIRITSCPTTYGYLLRSPVLTVEADSCYRVSHTASTMSGGTAILGIDPSTSAALGSSIFLFAVNGHDNYEPEVEIRTGSTTRIQVLITAANPEGNRVTEIELSNPEISACQKEHGR